MRLRIRPLRFLALLVGFLICTFLAWKPLAPAYAQVLLRAAQAGIWLSEFSTDPQWSHPTVLFIDAQRSPTGIFHVQTTLGLAAPPPAGTPILDWLRGNPGVVRVPPQGIPAEWVMANLVLLIPLMLATPAPSWRARFGRLAVALVVALVLQVADVVVTIKVFYAGTFRGYWSRGAYNVYQFLDAFFQSWDTQLFPFAIWAGIHFRQLLGRRTAPAKPTGETPLFARASTSPKLLAKAKRRRERRKR